MPRLLAFLTPRMFFEILEFRMSRLNSKNGGGATVGGRGIHSRNYHLSAYDAYVTMYQANKWCVSGDRVVVSVEVYLGDAPLSYGTNCRAAALEVGVTLTLHSFAILSEWSRWRVLIATCFAAR